MLGAEPLTVKELSENEIHSLKTAIKKIFKSDRQREAIEGDTLRKEASFRNRNRALISAKKEYSDYLCEICGFNFEGTYGNIGHKYIIAHHLRLISSGRTRTTFDDIVLICANCHSMVHRQNPPFTINQLKQIVARHLTGRSPHTATGFRTKHSTS